MRIVSEKNKRERRGEMLCPGSIPVTAERVVERSRNARGTVTDFSAGNPMRNPYLHELDAAQIRMRGIRIMYVNDSLSGTRKATKMHPSRNAGAHGGAAALSCDGFSSPSELLKLDMPSRYAKNYFQPASSSIQGACSLHGEQATH
jgi:hypothetical protein